MRVTLKDREFLKNVQSVQYAYGVSSMPNTIKKIYTEWYASLSENEKNRIKEQYKRIGELEIV